MRHLSNYVLMLITAVLALLLTAYVFLGGSSSKDETDQQARCSSREAFELVKADLFRRAAALRRTNDPAFARLAEYSIVRSSSKILRDTDEGSGTVTCSGSIVLDLPPGVQVVGGRRSLDAKVSYVLAGQPGQALQLRGLSNAEPITVPLAAVTTSGSATGQPLAAPPVPPEEMNANSAEAEPARGGLSSTTAGAVPPPVRAPERSPARAADQPRRPAVAPSRPQKPRAAPVNTSARAAKPAPRPAPAARAAAPVAPVAVRPSFNCRYARTYGEVAVCRDPGLASLDRQMAAEFYRGASGASPGVRAMLNRSRTRFLKSRDSCRTNACVAEAYRQRIDEISNITSGRF